MSRLINMMTMTVDSATDVDKLNVAEGEHDSVSRGQFADAAGMLVRPKTYEGLAGFWPQQTGEWAEMAEDVIERDSKPNVEFDGIQILAGCGEPARHLIAGGLVDELRFWVHPTRWGEGTRPCLPGTVPTRLLESTPYDLGVTLLCHEAVRP